MRHIYTVSILIVFLVSASLSCLCSEPKGEENYLSLFYPESEIVSGATKSIENIRTAPATVRVFTKEEIADLGANTLSDLLNLLSSAIIAPQTNSKESLWFRGIRNRYNDKVLLLVDSVPISNPIYSHSPVDEYLTLDNIERVEVIFGPSSALYGSNAFSGTINIITKKPEIGSYFHTSLKGGNYDTKGAFIEYNYKKGDFGIYSYFSYYETDGDGLDRDCRYKPNILKWNPKERIAGGVTLEYKDWFLRLNRIHYKNTYYGDWDIPIWRWKDEGYYYNDTFSSIEKKFNLSNKTSISFMAYYADYDLKNFWRDFKYTWNGKIPDPYQTVSTLRNTIDALQNGIKSGSEIKFDYTPSEKLQTIAGVTYERIKTGRVEDLWTNVSTGVTTRPFYIDPHSLSNYAGFLQQSLKLGDKLTILGGLRVDHLDLYGTKTTPRISFVYTPTKKTVFKVLYGEAFRQPSMREYYTVDLTGSFIKGNTSLDPEKIRTLEVSASHFTERVGDFSLTFFGEWTYDEIGAENTKLYSNYPGNRIRGLEANYHYSVPKLVDIRLGYSRNWCNLYNVPGYIIKGESVFSLTDKIKFSINGGYTAKRPRDPKDNFYYDPTKAPYKRGPVGGYLLLNSTLRIYPIFKNFELSASIYNLLNRDYFLPTYDPTKYYDLKAPNRTFLIRFGVKF
jgi:outer membrane receptor protein involved in Fe transport